MKRAATVLICCASGSSMPWGCLQFAACNTGSTSTGIEQVIEQQAHMHREVCCQSHKHGPAAGRVQARYAFKASSKQDIPDGAASCIRGMCLSSRLKCLWSLCTPFLTVKRGSKTCNPACSRGWEGREGVRGVTGIVCRDMHVIGSPPLLLKERSFISACLICSSQPHCLITWSIPI